MLKWAVNNSSSTAATRTNSTASIGLNWLSADKIRNHINSSTPLQGKSFEFGTLPLCANTLSYKGNVQVNNDLSDISRITTTALTTTLQTTPINRKLNIPRCQRYNKNRNITCTLPTYDAEYSPCSQQLISGPTLALRGIGIPDVYFQKPRYLQTDVPLSSQAVAGSTLSSPTSTSKIKANKGNSIESYSNDISDGTLNHLIDAILETSTYNHENMNSLHRYSTMKTLSCLQRGIMCNGIRACHNGQSPTYTRAEDPASDLLDTSGSNENGCNKADCGRLSHQSCEAMKVTNAATLPPKDMILFHERDINDTKYEYIADNNITINNNRNINSITNYYQFKQQSAMERKRRRNSHQSRSSLSFVCKSCILKISKPSSICHTMQNIYKSKVRNQDISVSSSYDSMSSLEEDICATLKSTKRRLNFLNSSPCVINVSFSTL